MKIISHRGNLHGRKPECENNPTYIDQAISSGFNVEIDVWFVDGEFFLGHDAPTYLIDSSWLSSRAASLWCHAKNLEAIERMLMLEDVVCFWHETDRMTLTSNGIPWLYPNNYSSIGITVYHGKPTESVINNFGVCTDYPLEWINHQKAF